MSTVNRNLFGFSGWTNLIQLISLINFTTFINVNSQRVTRPNVPSNPPISSSHLSPSLTQSTPTAIQQTKCPYSNEAILGVIFTSVVVTIVVIGLTLIAVWFLWKKKIITFAGGGGNHSIRDVNLNDKTLQVGATKQHQPNGNLSNDEDKQYKRLIKSLPPLTSVFNNLSNQSKGPIKSLDDTFIMTKPEQVSVQMTGHDFTGLGFNICGNMRDGIFIKDVLTRGPANESGLIKAGDRIMSITVSCEKMVYEDALTILSYASPYDVTLQVEKTSKSKLTTPNGVTGNGHIYIPRRYANGFSGSSDPSNHRILHPVFRSHSVGELNTRLNSSGGVGDDDKPSSLEEKSFGSIKSINSLLKKIKTSLYRSTASIKSNQSDKGKITTDYCSTNGLNDGSEGGYHHSCYSLDASGLMNGQISSSSSYILPSPTPIMNNGKSNEVAIDIGQKEKEPMISTIKLLSASSPGPGGVIDKISEEMVDSKDGKLIINEFMGTSGSPTELGQSRKLNQGKRKAPAPPSPSSSTCSIEIKNGLVDDRDDGFMAIIKNTRNELRSTTPGGSKVETHADIHHEQGSSEDFSVLQGQSLSDISEIKSSAIDMSMSIAMESLSSEDPSTPLAANLVKEMKGTSRASSPAAGKSKSCSLSDLTLVKNKKPSSTIILERAVSLDLRDQLGPEENKILQQGTMIEDNQGLLRWSEAKPSVCGPDSLSTTYSSEMLGSNSKTNEFTDDSLTITVDESSEKSTTAPKPAERTSLKKNSLSNSTDSRLRSSSKFEAFDVTINEEENIVAPPDGFGSDNQQQPEITTSSKPSIEDVKLKSNSKPETEGLEESTSKVTKFTTINGPSQSVQLSDKTSSNTQKTKPSISEKPPTLTSKFERLSPSQERLDSTLFDVPTKIEIPSPTDDEISIKTNGSRSEKDHLTRELSSSSSSSIINNRYLIEPEVIEISPNELSQVMMSHEEFLAHKSKLSYGKSSKMTSSCNVINKTGMNGIGVSGGHGIMSKAPPATIIQIGETGDNDFESWSYLSDIESNLPSLSNETRYKTTCDMGQLNDRSDEMLVKKI